LEIFMIISEPDMKLEELDVLVLDCQATSSNPVKGKLLEIGWTRFRPGAYHSGKDSLKKLGIDDAHIKAYLTRRPNGESIPRQVSRITGIGPEDLRGARSPEAIWRELAADATTIASSSRRQPCPTVIHFCRYEEPFLRSMHQSFEVSGTGRKRHDFPFEILCTHKIASRLLPGLPRKTLRSVAGYYGMSLPESRRCRAHVLATAFIWRESVRELKEKHQIHTWVELRSWLSQSAQGTAGRRAREYPMEEADLQQLHNGPGIYRMYRTGGDLLYIGKAKSVKKRVRSYFYARSRHAEHTLEMLSQARHLSFTATGSALEAAVLESDEIKRYRPPYNRALTGKDRKPVFFSSDLRHYRARPDSRFAVGPISSQDFLLPLSKLSDILRERTKSYSARKIESILNIPQEHLPAADCFAVGIQEFQQEHLAEKYSAFDLSSIMALGSLFWREKLEKEKAEAEKKRKLREAETPGSILPPASADGNHELELSVEPEVTDVEGNEWTPERVKKTLQSVLRFGTFQIRRARWFIRLCESTLCWTSADSSTDHKNLILITEGQVTRLEPIPIQADPPEPSGHEKSLKTRQAGFDIATFDRMRIVTTEIRRLLEEGRCVELCFHPEVRFGNEQLKKMLIWI
jgi:DNA polymerase-3 subunit epsilon